ncbi:MAG: hypothetical protein K9M75_02125, partial [Phycisphaerae bacterium]|nr:hypothetical protein [Phycisphaerae bacterium]
WLKLKIESPRGLQYIFVASTGAIIVSADSGKIATYPAGSFFKGLSRPWMGLHTIDTIRRDAAEKQIMFETNYTAGQVKADVSVLYGQTTAVYTVDMERDLIEKIEFINNSDGDSETVGSLEFSYLQQADMSTLEFKEPVPERSRRFQHDAMGISWLSQLAEGKLAD